MKRKQYVINGGTGSLMQPNLLTSNIGYTVVALVHLEYVLNIDHTFSYSGRPNTTGIYAMQRLNILLQWSP